MLHLANRVLQIAFLKRNPMSFTFVRSLRKYQTRCKRSVENSVAAVRVSDLVGSSKGGMALDSSSSSLDKYKNFIPNDSEIWDRWVRRALQIRKEGAPDSDFDNDEEVVSPFGPDPFDLEKPEYDRSFLNLRSRSIQRRKRFDVISLLSTRGSCLVRNGGTTSFTEAKSLKGKYVLVFCVFLPAKWAELNSLSLCLLSHLSSELGSREDFEMVMVAKMRKGWEEDERAFNQFFSAFSGRLAVPFEDQTRRDYICKLLNFKGRVRTILIDPKLKVLQNDAELICSHGAAGFPFTYERLKALDDELSQPWASSPHGTLAWLLCRHPSFSLRRLNSEETTSFEQLSKKLVGLYLFQGGDKLRAFNEVYLQCRDQSFPFEIVFVCLPIFTTINPTGFRDAVLRGLKDLNISWWIFPCDNSVCLRLLNLWTRLSRDEMIIIGPDSQFVDDCGGKVIYSFGMEAYPFTREQAVQTYLMKAMGVTLESLLSYESINYLYRDGDCNGERVPVAELQGKNVLVYSDGSTWRDPYIYGKVVEWYTKIKEVDSEFELVFVPLMHPRVDLPSEVCQPKSEPGLEWLVRPLDSKWLVRPLDSNYSDFWYNHHAFFGGISEMHVPRKGLNACEVLAFGKDGLIYTLDAIGLFEDHGLNAYLYPQKYSDLRQEIIDKMGRVFEFMMGYYCN